MHPRCVLKADAYIPGKAQWQQTTTIPAVSAVDWHIASIFPSFPGQ